MYLSDSFSLYYTPVDGDWGGPYCKMCSTEPGASYPCRVLQLWFGVPIFRLDFKPLRITRAKVYAFRRHDLVHYMTSTKVFENVIRVGGYGSRMFVYLAVGPTDMSR